MARLVERILVWVAGLVTVAALIAVIFNFLPGTFGGFRWMHPDQSGGTTNSTIDLAEQALSRNDASSALRLARQAVAESSSDATVANRAGNVALRAGDTKAAEKYYLAGESADPRYPWNYVALGQLYEREGKKEVADEQLRAASAAAPDQAFIHYDLGVVEMQEGLYAAALADFETELKRSPTYRPAMIGRAEALEKMGRKGEAVALYRKAGVNAHKPNAAPPKLKVTPLVQPSPSPTPTPTATATKVAVASPKPSLKPSPKAQRSAPPSPLAIARASATPGPVRPPWATTQPSATPKPSPVVATAPTTTAKPLSEVSADARGYLLDVTQELDFTHALPAADSSQPTATLRSSLVDALARKPIDIDSVLQVGTAALLSGRMPLAAAAFNAASDGATRDWRGPYFAGLTAQASGEMAQARTLFNNALARQQRAEIYTSLAAVALDGGDSGTAASDARRAVQINPSYEPGRFVAGMLDLIQSDVRGAQSNLAAAQALGGAPSRTAYFLNALHDIVGAAGASGG